LALSSSNIVNSKHGSSSALRYLLFYILYNNFVPQSFFFSPETHNPRLIALHTKNSPYLIIAAFVCFNNFFLLEKWGARTSYSIQDTRWSWLYTEEKQCVLFCSWCFFCCCYDLQLSL